MTYDEVVEENKQLRAENARLHKMAYLTIRLPKFLQRKV